MGVYDKLGDLLNEALEKGEIPKSKDYNKEETATFSTNNAAFMHKYTNNMHKTDLPDYIINILTTLDIVYPVEWKNITEKYHKLLKEMHPDTKNTIQNQESVNNFKQYTISDLQNMYKILDNYFNKQ